MERLFHIFYVGVKRGFGHAERAAFIFALFQSFLLCSLYFFGSIGVSSIFSKALITGAPFIYAVILCCLVIGVFILNSKYFVKTGRYRKIIDKYGGQSQFTTRQRVIYLMVLILLITISMVIFIWSGISLSKHLSI